MEYTNDSLLAERVDIPTVEFLMSLPESIRNINQPYWLQSKTSNPLYYYDGEVEECKLTDFKSFGVRPLVTFCKPGAYQQWDILTHNGLKYDIPLIDRENDIFYALCRECTYNMYYKEEESIADLHKVRTILMGNAFYDTSDIKAYCEFIFPKDYKMIVVPYTCQPKR